MLLSLKQLDLSMVLLLRHNRYEHLMAPVAHRISRTGDGYFYLLLGALLFLFEPITGPDFVKAGLLAFAIERPLYWVLKNTCRRSRPAQLEPSVHACITPSDQFSFPSGHTMAAFLVAGQIGQFYPEWYPLALVWSSLVGLSRVVLGVHFPSDIVAGALLGLTLATLI